MLGGGDESHLEELNELTRREALAERVQFGVATRQELAREYAAADALLFPVRWREPWGLVPLEAMGVGTPVVASGRGGSGEYLRDGENCLLFDADEGAPPLAAAVRRLAGDADLRSTLRERGLETVAGIDPNAFHEAAEEMLLAAGGGPVEHPRPEPVGSRRRLAARGTVINSGFQIGLGSLNFLKALIAAGLLTAADSGVWGALFLAVGLVVAVKTTGVSDKFIQQDEADQEIAFQKAFTLELLSSLILVVRLVALAPLLALAYGQEELLVPGLVIALVIPGFALQSPIWIFYRRMDFLRQRLLSAVDPVTSFVVTVALAVAGLGYWSLVIGFVAGSLGRRAGRHRPCPYPLRFRTSRHDARVLQLLLAADDRRHRGLMIGFLSLFFGDLALGLAGAGAIALAANYAAYTDRIDTVITQTIYPAICRVRDNRQLLEETFIKSNRLTLMWGMPFGIALSLRRRPDRVRDRRGVGAGPDPLPGLRGHGRDQPHRLQLERLSTARSGRRGRLPSLSPSAWLFLLLRDRAAACLRARGLCRRHGGDDGCVAGDPLLLRPAPSSRTSTRSDSSSARSGRRCPRFCRCWPYERSTPVLERWARRWSSSGSTSRSPPDSR